MGEALKSRFEVARDGVDPHVVPRKVLNNGVRMPVIGMGTFGSDRFSSGQIANAVIGAAECGQRSFDCASVYGNEKEIGRALQVIQAGGVPREELFITSKVWNDAHRRVVESCRQSLQDLQLEYLDLYLVHWPFPNFHPIGCSVDSRSPDARPYIHADFMETWAQMEKLVELGLVRSIGVSNMTIPKLALLLRDCRIKPAACEFECHPHFQQPALFDYLVANGIQPIGYCPVGSPNRPERDKTPDDTSDIEDPVVVRIAERLGVHPGLLCIKWALQHGVVPIPFSVKAAQYQASLRCAFPDVHRITDAEMAELATVDKNCRLIKGHVFLWKDGQTWEDLWDLDGTIAQ